MSEENVETLRRALEGLASGGIEELIAHCSPDIVVHPIPEWMEKPVYQGHGGFRELLVGWTEGFEDFAPEIGELRDVGDDRVVWLGSTVGRIRGTNVPISQPVGGVQRFGDGLIIEVWFFMTWAEALEAAGLSE
jgi:ketosteroid isomerase-like protein